MSDKGFVKVKHTDGREADITEGEVAFYRSIGFAPVDGYQPSGDGSGDDQVTASESLQPPTNGTDQRLDLVLDELRGLRGYVERIFTTPDAEDTEVTDPILDELRGLRADLAAQRSASKPEPKDGETVELRGVETPTTTTTTTPKPTPKR